MSQKIVYTDEVIVIGWRMLFLRTKQTEHTIVFAVRTMRRGKGKRLAAVHCLNSDVGRVQGLNRLRKKFKSPIYFQLLYPLMEALK